MGIRSTIENMFSSPARVLFIGFALTILVGTGFLMLPWASVPGVYTTFTDALFTSTSAVCVTGLTTVNTAAHWTAFGKIAIIILIQVGGLGIMTISTAVAMLLGRRIGLKERMVIQEATGQIQMSGLIKLVRYILAMTVIIEGIGATLLSFRFVPLYGFPRGVAFGVFHSVSAFCNAGFDIIGNSIMDYAADPLVVLTISGLIILGGIGFVVIGEIWKTRLKSRLTLHSRLALKMTGILLLTGTMAMLLLEVGNSQTLLPLTPLGKVLSAWFHAVTPRTAGFNTLDVSKLRPATKLLTIVLMFIGASPGGTGGGIKTTTFAVIWAGVLCAIRRREEPCLMNRRLGADLMERSLAIAMISLTLVLGTTFILIITESGHELLPLLFETTSAFGTVGLSTGVTPTLSTVGRITIILTMFMGRVGPLTVAIALATPPRGGAVRYPEEKVIVG
jgi:trk system potassium uptake protein TrkH